MLALARSSQKGPLSWWWIGAAVTLAVGIRLGLGALDRRRIRNYLAEHGCVALHIAWTFMLIAGENERHYNVTYRTRDGRTITGFCKTSVVTGVWWKENGPG